MEETGLEGVVVLGELEMKYGKHHSEGADGQWIWDGETTRIEAKKLLTASGSGVEITVSAKNIGADMANPGSKPKKDGSKKATAGPR